MLMNKIEEHKIHCSNFIVDELGLVGNNIIQLLKEKFPYSKIYAMGDELQLK